MPPTLSETRPPLPAAGGGGGRGGGGGPPRVPVCLGAPPPRFRFARSSGLAGCGSRTFLRWGFGGSGGLPRAPPAAGPGPRAGGLARRRGGGGGRAHAPGGGRRRFFVKPPKGRRCSAPATALAGVPVTSSWAECLVRVGTPSVNLANIYSRGSCGRREYELRSRAASTGNRYVKPQQHTQLPPRVGADGVDQAVPA